MPSNSLWAISPLDGRYSTKTVELTEYFSEAGLISARVKIEILYLNKLSQTKIIRSFSSQERQILKQLQKLTVQDLNQIKKIEEKTHHDIKAIEYFIRTKIKHTSLKNILSYIHFGLTSNDINNLAYRLLFESALNQILVPYLINILRILSAQASENMAVVILARTHGQAAIPTTLGKEFSVFAQRLFLMVKKLVKFKFSGKLSGAVGGYHALNLSYAKTNWLKFSQEFVESFGFEFIANTTQINPSDDLVELFGLLSHINSILLDLNQDIWRYISDNWLVQTKEKNDVGSSTMPQKVNPIEFENSEGNIILANALFSAFIQKLPVSRLQRDLSESTVNRNIGSAFAYTLLAYKSLVRGLKQLAPNQQKIDEDLNKNWNILAEAAQTMARKKGDKEAYEKIAKLSKKQIWSSQDWQRISQIIDPALVNLTPSNYLGLSKNLTQRTVSNISSFLKERK